MAGHLPAFLPTHLDSPIFPLPKAIALRASSEFRSRYSVRYRLRNLRIGKNVDEGSVSDISTDLDSKWTITSSSKAQDVEASGASTVTGAPLNLKNSVHSDSELAELRRRKKKADMVKYQNRQNDLITYLLKPLEQHTSDAKDEEG
ncbi:uncharacterized protein ARMOST_03135 [Armillaria ostoyae]|uniref:Uncharacterized protein n=1 Tax=Armillaria ostoyae TaxID=47428 RepID=A0A284QTL3_ARMOS|nr:uncharacterized protein ARMOST_03135 [Armillaria ostoyae]